MKSSPRNVGVCLPGGSRRRRNRRPARPRTRLSQRARRIEALRRGRRKRRRVTTPLGRDAFGGLRVSRSRARSGGDRETRRAVPAIAAVAIHSRSKSRAAPRGRSRPYSQAGRARSRARNRRATRGHLARASRARPLCQCAKRSWASAFSSSIMLGDFGS